MPDPADALVEDSPDARLRALGITLPDIAPAPVGLFTNLRRARGLIFISGQGPVRADGSLVQGKVGRDFTAVEARDHARLVAANILAVIRTELGSLAPVAGVVKLLGLVNATPDFTRHPFVIDGASALLADIFGPTGIHARSSVGVNSLPNNIPVEIEAIFEERD